MSQHKKTIELLRRKSKNISFEQAEGLILYLEFFPTKKGSSHIKYVHSSGKSINLVRNRNLKGYLIEDVLEILDYLGVGEDV